MYKKFLFVLFAAALLVFSSSCAGEVEKEQPTIAATQPVTPEETQPQDYMPIKSDKKLNKQGLADNISDGVIFHAWCWSFNTIKENMQSIAGAGFSTIQTSPINLCKVGDGGGMQLQDTSESIDNGKWYYHYQPVDYTIGNYQMGTEEEFKEMCKEADKYGVKIIVDAVVNHMTSDRSAISENVMNLENPFHDLGEVVDYSDREEVTQGSLLGLVDLNTQNPVVQQYILSYLKTCVEAGADGFRYDGAKHIELEDDDESYAGDFWNVVLNNGSKFQYGEILQGGSDRIRYYSKKMNVTSSKYGESVRNGLFYKNLSAALLENFQVEGVDNSKIVTWVESHDNYCNDRSWLELDEAAVKRGWAIIAARKGGTPLFFSRPMNADSENPWGNNVIGDPGSDFYKDKEVAEVNKFRNEMIGEDESISNPGDNTELLMIERGKKGLVMVNAGENDQKLEQVNCSIADSTYTDKISGEKFTVKNGKLSGTIEAEQIIVLY